MIKQVVKDLAEANHQEEKQEDTIVVVDQVINMMKMKIRVVNAEDPVDAKHPAKLANHHAKHHAKHAEAADANNLVDVADADHPAEHPANHHQAVKLAKNQAADAAVAHASKFF